MYYVVLFHAREDLVTRNPGDLWFVRTWLARERNGVMSFFSSEGIWHEHSDTEAGSFMPRDFTIIRQIPDLSVLFEELFEHAQRGEIDSVDFQYWREALRI